MKLQPPGVLPAGILLLLSLAAMTPGRAEILAFSALYRSWHEPSQTPLEQARVIVSDSGLRIEQLIGQSGNVFLANYVEDTFWFLDRRRQIAHAIPVQVSTGDTSSPATAQPEGLPAMIQFEPCQALQGLPGGQSLLQGRVVEHWTCHVNGVPVEQHWYAPVPGVVVRTIDSDGFASELTDIHQRRFDSAFFRPPSHYRRVEIEELINPAVPISSYIEKKKGQP